MKARIENLKGGVYEKGFYVVGDCKLPHKGFSMHIQPVIVCSNKTRTGDRSWFMTQEVKKVIATSFGYLFVAGGALWKWQPICQESIFNHKQLLKDLVSLRELEE